MKRSHVLNDREIKRVFATITRSAFPARNSAMFMLSIYAGMRVGEVAALRFADVIGADGNVLAELRLAAEQTKGERGRVVYVPEKLRKEPHNYVQTFARNDATRPLFYTQKREGWTANTLTQHFHYLYRRAGLVGASSHSGRRTFLTTLANKGIGIRVLQALAGHRDIRTTSVYIEANDALKRAAVELV